MSAASKMNREVFAALWNNHSVPTKAIADAMGITHQGVSWHAKRMGLPSRAKLRRRLYEPELFTAMWHAGVASAEIAKHFGMAYHSCAITAARALGLPYRKRGASGKLNGGWLPTITADDFFNNRAQEALASLLAASARETAAAMLDAEMVDNPQAARWPQGRAA